MRKPTQPEAEGLAAALEQRLVGQQGAIDAIVPFVELFQAGLAPEGRPAGVFLLLGPTGTGKTRTVEALADALHGSERSMLKIDCGEFQMEHEVAKLVGSPPGYLGHRETPPLLTQARLNTMASDKSGISLLLFDEIEKAAPSMYQLLLGILDKATLRLGDNTSVNFERTMIFLTSNLGARGMAQALDPSFGFARMAGRTETAPGRFLERIAMTAVRKKFSPEFVNRIDRVVTYQPLDPAALDRILDLQLAELQAHLDRRLAGRSFSIELTPEARAKVLEQGTSIAFGARELKRTLQRQLLQPMASLLAAGRVAPQSRLVLDADSEQFRLLVEEPLAA